MSTPTSAVLAIAGLTALARLVTDLDRGEFVLTAFTIMVCTALKTQSIAEIIMVRRGVGGRRDRSDDPN